MIRLSLIVIINVLAPRAGGPEGPHDLQPVDDAHAVHPEAVVAAQQHGQRDHVALHEAQPGLQADARVALHHVVLGEEPSVDLPRAEDEDVGVVRRHGVHEVRRGQEAALGLPLFIC